MNKRDCDNCIHMGHKQYRFGYLYACKKSVCEPEPKKPLTEKERK